jgi:predicted DNA-binding transcriptional regulator YafY
MTGWQDRVSVGERRSAVLLAALVNARRALSSREILSLVPEYDADPANASLQMDDDIACLRSYGLDIEWGGPGSESVSIRVPAWQHRPVDLGDVDRRLLEEAAGLAAPLDPLGAEAMRAVRGEPLQPEADTAISLSPRGSAARGRPLAYSRLHRLVWLAERGATAGFGYPDATGEFHPRHLQLAGLGESRGVWYAVGFEPGSKTIRAFAVSEMLGPVIEAEPPGTYELPFGFDTSEYLALSWRLGPDPEPARVRFDPDLATYVGSMLSHIEIESLPDGSVEVVVSVGDMEDFVGWTLSFGSHALILEPASAAARAREVLATVVARHG